MARQKRQGHSPGTKVWCASLWHVVCFGGCGGGLQWTVGLLVGRCFQSGGEEGVGWRRKLASREMDVDGGEHIFNSQGTKQPNTYLILKEQSTLDFVKGMQWRCIFEYL